jgi:regulator of replication initiation timing
MAREADFYTPGEAARALRLTEFTILGLLTNGQLEGHQDEQGRWWIPASAIDDVERSSAGTDAQPDPSLEETISMTSISPMGSADTPATDTPAREETIQFEAVADPMQRTPAPDRHGKSDSESGWTTTDQSARALGVSPRTVRRFIDRGELEGRKVIEGIVESWEVSIDSLYALRDKRISEGQVRRNVPRPSEQSQNMTDTSDTSADHVRDLTDRLLRLSSEVGELRGRLELTEKAESTLQEERDRLRVELEREREDRREAREEAQRLREELEAERSKGFWSRLFGG